MSEINTDISKNLDLIIRKDNDVKIIITALDGSGDPFDFTGATISVLLFRSKDQSPFITKVSDVDTDYVSISSNVITVNLIDDLTSISPGKYYWALRYTDSTGIEVLKVPYASLSDTTDQVTQSSGVADSIKFSCNDVLYGFAHTAGEASLTVTHTATYLVTLAVPTGIEPAIQISLLLS